MYTDIKIYIACAMITMFLLLHLSTGLACILCSVATVAYTLSPLHSSVFLCVDVLMNGHIFACTLFFHTVIVM